MKSAALELGQYNITVNALIPGLVDTALRRYNKSLTESMEETGRKCRARQRRDRHGMRERRQCRARWGLGPAGRYLPSGGVPGLGCVRDGHGRRIQPRSARHAGTL